MAKRVKLSDDEIVAKKVFQRIDNAKKTVYYHKQKTKNINTKATTGSGKEVLIKITSSSKDMKGLSAHIDYISRNGKLDIYCSEYEKYSGREENTMLKSFFQNDGTPIPYEKGDKPLRQTFNMVFSMKGTQNISEKIMRKSVINTVKSNYPNNMYALAFHGDTNNPHCHLILKIADKDGKRIDIKKNDLAKLRRDFAKELNSFGIEAVATTRNYTSKFPNSKNMHFHEVVSFGADNYKHNLKNDSSYFIKLKSKNKTYEIWGKELKKLVHEENIKKGEKIKLKISGTKSVEVNYQKREADGQLKTYTKDVQKNIWSVERLEQTKDKKIKNMER